MTLIQRHAGQADVTACVAAEVTGLSRARDRVLLTRCLVPFRVGAPHVQTASYDYRADGMRRTDAEVPSRAILIVDGVLLLRPQLRDLWTLSVYLRVSPEEILNRAAARDLALFGSHDEIQRRYLERYRCGTFRLVGHQPEARRTGGAHAQDPVLGRSRGRHRPGVRAPFRCPGASATAQSAGTAQIRHRLIAD